LAEALQEACDVDAELIGGAGGIFDVKVNGQLIFSKHETGRFPEHEEILRLLKPAKSR
jgi:selenoprotein W-related protein